MKYLMFLTTVLLSLNFALVAHESAYRVQVSNELLDACSNSISKIEDGKAYLLPEKLCFYKNQPYIQNDMSQWISLERVYWNGERYYIDARDPTCPNGHIGIYRVKGTWYCNEDGCPYFIGENFAH